jgi:hypothetical protein
VSLDPLSTSAARRRRRGPRRGPGRLALGIVLRVLVLAAVFAAGVALGEALHDNPKPGGSRTGVRTLKPLPLPPVRRTVTVTTAR